MNTELDMLEFEKLDEVIERLLERMSTEDPTSDEYEKMVDHLVKLMKSQEIISNVNAKVYEAEVKAVEMLTPRRVSPDTWAIVGTNIAGILLVIGHERVNVIASKALGFILRTR